jgi:hypothetical protein
MKPILHPLSSILAALCALCASALNAPAQSYLTASATGTTSAQVLFPADNFLAQQVVSLDVTSDLSSSVLTFQSGVVSYPITATATNTTNIVVSAYGTLASNDVVILQTTAGVLTNATVYSVTNATNINFKAATGITVNSGDNVFKLGNTRTTTVGATTLRLNGPAIFVTDQAQPCLVKITGTSACAINNVVVVRGR